MINWNNDLLFHLNKSNRIGLPYKHVKIPIYQMIFNGTVN